MRFQCDYVLSCSLPVLRPVHVSSVEIGRFLLGFWMKLLRSGRRGRRFESSLSDQSLQRLMRYFHVMRLSLWEFSGKTAAAGTVVGGRAGLALGTSASPLNCGLWRERGTVRMSARHLIP